MQLQGIQYVLNLLSTSGIKIQIFNNYKRVVANLLRKSALAGKLLYFARKTLGVLMRLRAMHRTTPRVKSALNITLTSTTGTFLTEELLRRTGHFATRLRLVRTLTLVCEIGIDRQPHRMLVRLDTKDLVRKRYVAPRARSAFR